MNPKMPHEALMEIDTAQSLTPMGVSERDPLNLFRPVESIQDRQARAIYRTASFTVETLLLNSPDLRAKFLENGGERVDLGVRKTSEFSHRLSFCKDGDDRTLHLSRTDQARPGKTSGGFYILEKRDPNGTFTHLISTDLDNDVSDDPDAFQDALAAILHFARKSSITDSALKTAVDDEHMSDETIATILKMAEKERKISYRLGQKSKMIGSTAVNSVVDLFSRSKPDSKLGERSAHWPRIVAALAILPVPGYSESMGPIPRPAGIEVAIDSFGIIKDLVNPAEEPSELDNYLNQKMDVDGVEYSRVSEPSSIPISTDIGDSSQHEPILHSTGKVVEVPSSPMKLESERIFEPGACVRIMIDADGQEYTIFTTDNKISDNLKIEQRPDHAWICNTGVTAPELKTILYIDRKN
jgi:hypothetical protein